MKWNEFELEVLRRALIKKTRKQDINFGFGDVSNAKPDRDELRGVSEEVGVGESTLFRLFRIDLNDYGVPTKPRKSTLNKILAHLDFQNRFEFLNAHSEELKQLKAAVRFESEENITQGNLVDEGEAILTDNNGLPINRLKNFASFVDNALAEFEIGEDLDQRLRVYVKDHLVQMLATFMGQQVIPKGGNLLDYKVHLLNSSNSKTASISTEILDQGELLFIKIGGAADKPSQVRIKTYPLSLVKEFGNFLFHEIRISYSIEDFDVIEAIEKFEDLLETEVIALNQEVHNSLIGYFKFITESLTDYSYKLLSEYYPSVNWDNLTLAYYDRSGFAYYIFSEMVTTKRLRNLSTKVKMPIRNFLEAFAVYMKFEDAPTSMVDKEGDGIIVRNFEESDYNPIANHSEMIHYGKKATCIKLIENNKQFILGLVPDDDHKAIQALTSLRGSAEFQSRLKYVFDRLVPYMNSRMTFLKENHPGVADVYLLPKEETSLSSTMFPTQHSSNPRTRISITLS